MSFFNNILGKVFKTYILSKGKKRLAKHEGAFQLKGLKEQVEVRRDSQGVPHIYAANREDLMFAQGFTHAQDRLWQMEVNRRLCLGRLSEVFGEAALDADRMCRTFGFARIGVETLAMTPDDVRPLLDAYVRGVNAFLQHPETKLPVEFSLAGYKPEPWKAEHLTAFSTMMLLQMSNGWAHELIRSRIIQAVGPERAAELDINYPEGNPITIPNGIEANAFTTDGRLQALGGPFIPQIKGSNAWAVSGKKTTTGKPILCNDPHLPLFLPSIWYQNHLVSPDYHVIGVSLPGLPMVMIGHNERISWGITLAYTDIEDLFVEKFEDASLKRYEHKGEWLDTQIIEEKIRIKKKKEPYIEKVAVTRNGPIISDIFESGQQKMALNAPALVPGISMMGFYSTNTAKNWNDFVEGIRDVTGVGLNIAYADVEGNIGYWVTGQTPIRGKGNGDVPAPAWTGEYDWTGFVPFEEMPHNLNPERGYVITCNHKIVPDDFPHYMGRVWLNGYRAHRLEELFKQKEKLSPEDFRKMQTDFFCKPGLEFAQLYKGFNSKIPAIHEAVQKMTSWDGMLSKDTVGGTIFEVTRYQMLKSLLEKGLAEELQHLVLGKGLDPILFGISEYLGHDTEILFNIIRNPDSWWLEKVGGLDALKKNAMEAAVQWLSKELGPDQSQWRWGRLHQIDFPHSMAVQKPLDRVFNIGPYELGGDTDTVCQTAFHSYEPFLSKVACPTYRQVIDMGDLSQSKWVLPPGQSGQIGSPHYADQADAWSDGELYPMLWTREQVEKDTKGVLILKKS